MFWDSVNYISKFVLIIKILNFTIKRNAKLVVENSY